MAKISASQVKELRDKTGVGMMEAKKALVQTEGDMDAAIDYLRERGVSKAAKKADRIAAEGLTSVLVDGTVAVNDDYNVGTVFEAKVEKLQLILADITATVAPENANSLEESQTVPVGDGTIVYKFNYSTTTNGGKLTIRRFLRLKKAA